LQAAVQFNPPFYEVPSGNSPDAVKAFQLYQQLAELKPFQPGFLANTYPESAGTFHDGKDGLSLDGNLGRVFNDACADIADGKMTAEKAAKTIQTSWEQNKQ
jgi:ABC-type glycerol-3-phosphate transport system substrate-binding protein